ncbi:MAG: cobalamin B12-binding domain-containing protein [Pseudomonadota bacterium]
MSPLISVLERRVIPQLAKSHGVQPTETAEVLWATSRAADPSPLVAADQTGSRFIKPLSEALLGNDLQAAIQIVAQHAGERTDGSFIDSCQDLLTPTAQLLGQLWEEDEADFHAVTLATGLLQTLLRSLPGSKYSWSTGPGDRSLHDQPRILLINAPNEQHGLGLSMLGRAFSQAGWIVEGGPSIPPATYLSRISEQNFDVAGVSIACSQWIEPCKQQIAALRQHSLNTDVKIIIGGQLAIHHPELERWTGADGSALDLHGALALARALIGERASSEAAAELA